MMQIDQSSFCTFFATFLQFYGSNQFASFLSSYTLQKMRADSKIWGKLDKGLQRYGESKLLGKVLSEMVLQKMCKKCAKSAWIDLHHLLTHDPCKN